MTEVLYTSRLMKQLQVATVFEQPDNKLINSLDFSDDGSLLVSCGNDNKIRIFNVLEQEPHCSKAIPSFKYGCAHVKFTHSNHSIIHTSTQINDDIRYLSLHDSKYLRYFKGHKKRVTGLDMSPTADLFLSSSEDNTVKLWDLRSNTCQGSITTEAPPVACFDSSGLVFAIATNKTSIQLFSVSDYSNGPFMTFDVPSARQASSWTSIQGSPDGDSFALATGEGLVHMIDAYEGQEKGVLGEREIATGEDMSWSFSPCGGFIACGGRDGIVEIWNTQTLEKDAHHAAHHDSVSCVKFNPQYALLATGTASLALWLPPPTID